MEFNKEQLLTHSCPTIKSQTKIEILHVHDFPATCKQFVTIRDTENFNYDFKGRKEAIISTIELTPDTFV